LPNESEYEETDEVEEKSYESCNELKDMNIKDNLLLRKCTCPKNKCS